MHSRKNYYVGFLACLLFVILTCVNSKAEQTENFNSVILNAIASMPTGGGYATSGLAMSRLPQAVVMREGKLIINPSVAKPSFCSEATYLVFLKAIAHLQEQGTCTLSPEILAVLQPKGQPDGQGIWGRWNANGPGVARLFYALGLGTNFTNLAAAQPGDFLKIFWNDGLGATEHGHLVVYLGTEKREGIDIINFWSSNIPSGYGKKSCRRSSIHRMLFSRLTNPQALLKTLALPNNDPYLASLLHRSTTPEEMKRYCGITDAP